jgi:hypothetical protein
MAKEIPLYLNFDMVPKAETIIDIIKRMED